ncbi:hypothetical protein CALVIDRAFT_602852 [Calocera viscosa TUFC12733]|uniref:Uncharacterized protein n=1 Tax=Calocera viscosa (strain TUFC12733) TaxID=1330018 RepID=A0A167GGE1_CALVF|nr:hypothetical protein CALVIDRAFT_602852 [Calocera viscosa TUFC12733]
MPVYVCGSIRHETELDYIRLTRTLSSYREELLSLRRQLNLPVDNLLSSPPISPLSLPLSPRSRAGSLGQHRGSWVHAASPLVSATAGGGGIGGAAASRRSPIPEDLSELEALSPPVHPLYPHSLARRPSHPSHYPASQSISTSTSSSSSANTSTTPSPYASLLSSVPQSAQSAFSPSSSPPFALSFGQGAAQGQGSTPWGLSYPSVPPPSLSSSLGSVSGSLPNSISSFPPGAYGPGSRRGSLSTAHPHPGMPGGGGGTGGAGEQRGRRVVETGSLRRARSGSRGPGSRLRTALQEGAGTNAVDGTGTGTGLNGTGTGTGLNGTGTGTGLNGTGTGTGLNGTGTGPVEGQ